MLRRPSSRSKRKDVNKLNLIPILDAVFIFIFFLLATARFINVFEINSDVPITSSAPPPANEKKPLALTLEIKPKQLEVYTGIPSHRVKTFGVDNEGKYPLEDLRRFMIDLKKENVDENTIIFEPSSDVEYERIVEIMDSVRELRNTDEAIFKKDKNGLEVKVKFLFNQIVFGNLMS